MNIWQDKHQKSSFSRIHFITGQGDFFPRTFAEKLQRSISIHVHAQEVPEKAFIHAQLEQTPMRCRGEIALESWIYR